MGRPRTIQFSHICPCCGKDIIERNLYKSQSILYSGEGFIPTCKDCMDKIYDSLYQKYLIDYGYDENTIDKDNDLKIQKKVMKRLCMMHDIYFSDNAFKAALKRSGRTVLACYMQVMNIRAYKGLTYEDTLKEEENNVKVAIENNTSETVDDNTIRFFGVGFSDEDYLFLQEQYDDWTTRHECKTKAQEEVFKQICFTQLELLKATRAKADTKDLTATFQKLLDTAKLQPKQNHSDAMSDAQTFGTLIDKWENTRPIPEVDDDLKDVDNIGLYMDVFFRGHIAKMLGLKNALSNLYSKFIKQYTVNKPEYDDDKDSEIIFDAIFGNQSLNSELDSDGGG